MPSTWRKAPDEIKLVCPVLGRRSAGISEFALPPVLAAKLFADYYEEHLKLYPLEATFAGDNRYDDLLPNVLTDSLRAELTLKPQFNQPNQDKRICGRAFRTWLVSPTG